MGEGSFEAMCHGDGDHELYSRRWSKAKPTPYTEDKDFQERDGFSVRVCRNCKAVGWWRWGKGPQGFWRFFELSGEQHDCRNENKP